MAVTLATVGVAVVVYGGASQQETANDITMTVRPTAPLLGNLLTLLASFGYGLYQVLYKIYATLPSDPESKQDSLYQSIPEDEELAAEREVSVAAFDDDAVYPPPYGLHANLLTSLMGVITCLVLGIFLPILHNTGLEIFHWPSNGLIASSIVGIALAGVVFNSGLMVDLILVNRFKVYNLKSGAQVLLGTWGPIITSVGNLLTIVLVLISDVSLWFGIITSVDLMRIFFISIGHLRQWHHNYLESSWVWRYCVRIRSPGIRHVRSSAFIDTRESAT